MFNSFRIIINVGDGSFLWVSDFDLEGNVTLSNDYNRASPFKSFYEASRIAALIDFPCILVVGVIINE